MDGLPAVPQPLEADGEQKQLLKSQPPPGQVQGFRALREVDVLIGVFRAAEVVFLPHAVGKHIRKNGGAGVQPLADGSGQNELAHPCRQGIDGHDAAREFPPPLCFHDGARHGLAEEIPLRLAVEDVRFSLAQVVFQPRLVEEGHIQHAGLVHGPDLHQIHSLADVGHRGGRRDHSRHTGGLAGDQFGNLLCLGAVVIPPGEPGDQVPERANAQLVQGLGPLLADALDKTDVSIQVRQRGLPLSRK